MKNPTFDTAAEAEAVLGHYLTCLKTSVETCEAHLEKFRTTRDRTFLTLALVWLNDTKEFIGYAHEAKAQVDKMGAIINKLQKTLPPPTNTGEDKDFAGEGPEDKGDK